MCLKLETYMRGATGLFVAQISNLLCRRLPACGRCDGLLRSADWKSAIQQIGNLRYSSAHAGHARSLWLIGWLALAATASAGVVGFDAFSYPDGAVNGRNGGAGWSRAGGLTAWSGGTSLPSVSGNVLYTGNYNAAVRIYGGDETGSAFQSTGVAFIKVTLYTGSTVPVSAGISSFDYGTERVYFGRLTNSTFGISEPGNGQALTAVTPAPNTRYTLIAVLDFTNQKLSLFINPTTSDYYNVGNGSSSAGLTKNFQTWFNWSTRVRLLSAGSAANVGWDNLTVATSPADVGLQPGGFVHAGGVAILDRNSEEIVLRGVSLGSWLWPELWMMGGPNLNAYAGADGFEQLNAAVQDVLGGDTNLTALALGAVRSNFVSQADIVFLHTNGFNSLRVPFHYELFYQVTNAGANYPANGYDLNTGFNYFDNLLAWCATNGIYVIPDMHGVPGGKDYAVAGNVYTNASNHALFLHVWQRFAARYATNPWIGGYDLINEPVNTSGGYVMIPGGLLSSTYADAIAAIRTVDINHMLICEGDWWATALGQINTTGWSDANVCYSDHRYGDALPFATDRKQIGVGANVPLWMGEFGYNSTHWNNYAITNFEKPDALSYNGRTATLSESWCYWSYKTPQLYVLAENPQTAGWNALKNYWNSPGTVARPSVANAFNWLLDYAQGQVFFNCLVHPEVVDSLVRPNASFDSQRLPYRSGMAIPGRIMATDYDMGANGVAYNDTVYDDESGKGPGGTAWNTAWYGRDEGVDTPSCADASTLLKIGWNVAGEWQRYTVSSTPGTYDLNIRYGSGGGGGQLHVLVNGVNVSGTVTLPNTGAYTTYSTYTVSNIGVSASGAATVEIDCGTAGYDLLWIEFQPVGAPPLAPGGLQATAGNAAVSLGWITCSGATGYSIRRGSAAGGPYTVVGSTASTGYQDTGLSNGTTYYYVVAATNANGTGALSAECSAIPQSNTLPPGWVSRDVGISRAWNGDAGDVGFAGSASASGGTYSVNGSGIDIWGAADSFQYAYRAVLGDCTIIAHVASQQGNDPWAKAGVMIRETLQFDSANAVSAITPQNGTLFSYRPATAGSSSSSGSSGVAPYWLKLVRSSNTFTGYRASATNSWSQIGSATIPMAASVFVGLAVTARNNLQTNTSTFDSLSVSCQMPPAPTSISATTSNAQVRLQWAAVVGAGTYNLKRSSTNNGPYTVIAGGLADTNYLDAGLASGSTYYYVVSAVNVNGEGPNSAQASATAHAPPQLAVNLVPGGGQLIIAWPGWATNLSLWATTSLAPPLLWSPVTNAVTPGDPLTVTLPVDNGNWFFRLATPP
jgi:aryl-phospho-beta-D-glucosidase BglC (GH1 family)